MAIEAGHPLWRTLALVTGTHDCRAPVTVHRLRVPDDGWREALEKVLAQPELRRNLLIAWDRGPVARIRTLRRERVLDWRRHPSPRDVAERVSEAGYSPVARFGVWPSVEAPRIAFPHGRVDTVGWLRRTGLWGGGGDSILLRAMARRVPSAHRLHGITPGVALICEPDSL